MSEKLKLLVLEKWKDYKFNEIYYCRLLEMLLLETFYRLITNEKIKLLFLQQKKNITI